MNDDDEIDLDYLASTMFPGINAQHREVMAALKRIEGKVNQLMADAASVLAKVTANTSVLKSIQTGIAAASEGHATLMEAIQALKDANPAVDFTPLDTAADEQATLLDGLAKAIPANTPAAPTP